jgi:hypothetical protein
MVVVYLKTEFLDIMGAENYISYIGDVSEGLKSASKA